MSMGFSIPACYDPVSQEERRQAQYDRYAASLPTCARCGFPIQSPLLLHIESHGEYFCKSCVDAMTEFNENLEVL